MTHRKHQTLRTLLQTCSKESEFLFNACGDSVIFIVLSVSFRKVQRVSAHFGTKLMFCEETHSQITSLSISRDPKDSILHSIVDVLKSDTAFQFNTYFYNDEKVHSPENSTDAPSTATELISHVEGDERVDYEVALFRM